MTGDYQEVEGVKCYAPSFAFENQDYPPEYFASLHRLEDRHFWFQSRQKLIDWLLKTFLKVKEAEVLEIGCGTGINLPTIKNHSAVVTAAEIHLEGLRFARSHHHDVEFVQMDARNIPWQNHFAAVCAFDVIEHIDEDEVVLQSIEQSLRPSGVVMLSVPQHQWLWSKQDDAAFHKRRYSRRELIKKLETAGFKISFVSSFVFTLLPLMYLSRKTINKKASSTHKYDMSELEISPLVNTLMGLAMTIDLLLIRMGLSLPVGGTLFVVAEKKVSAS